MAHILPPNTCRRALRAVCDDAKERKKAESYCYVDTPDFKYDEWLATTSAAYGCVGQAKGKVLVVGGGVSGCCAAAELCKAGLDVTLVEGEWELGGRCDSTRFEGEASSSKNLVELGAMRFTESEWCMSYYLEKFNIAPAGGIAALPTFPDPGKVTTWVCTSEAQELWKASDAANDEAPAGFKTVSEGWGALATDGVTLKAKKDWFAAPSQMQEWLKKSPNCDESLRKVTDAWQRYVDAFEGKSFYAAIFEIFTGTGPYAIPNDTPWTFDDFDKFGTIGVGSGGFGALYPIGFLEIFRLIVDGLEDEQRFLAKGVRSLPLALIDDANNSVKYAATRAKQIDVVLGTRVNKICKTAAGSFTVEYSGRRSALLDDCFQRVVLATTTRSMELTTNVTSSTELLDQKVSAAIRRTHVTSSAKVGLRIKKFWSDDECRADLPENARCLLSDNVVRQVYTLDYGAEDGSAVAFMTYTWDDDAVKQQGLGASERDGSGGGHVDKVRLYKKLYAELRTYGSDNAKLKQWITNITPYAPDGNPGDIVDAITFVEWQSKPAFNGAFKLSQPGQDEYVRTMFFDYQKANEPDLDTGLYVAGDCVAYTAGWVEGAIQTGLNATAAVIHSLQGTLYTVDKKSPLCIKQDRFHYFPKNQCPCVPSASSSKRKRADDDDDDEE